MRRVPSDSAAAGWSPGWGRASPAGWINPGLPGIWQG